MQVGLNPSLSYNKSISSINSNEYSSNNLNSNLSVNLSKSVEKKYEIDINNEFSNNYNSTSLNNDIKSFNSNNFNFNIKIYWTQKWKISNSYNLFTRQKTSLSCIKMYTVVSHDTEPLQYRTCGCTERFPGAPMGSV